MNKFDFNCYYELNEIKGYDGFIGTNGEFYKVKSFRSSDLNYTHLTWAEQYIRQDYKKISTLLYPSNSILFALSKLKTKQDILIHFFGFVYYSHDYYTNMPLIITPNPIYNEKYITKEQLEILYDIMKINLENPMKQEIFSEPDNCKIYRRN